MAHDYTIFDGLIISNWGRPVFEEMNAGGLAGANCTCAVWEGFEATMGNIARWKRMFKENADLIIQARSAQDIRDAKAAGKTGIALGFQNSWPIEDDLDRVWLFQDVGVRTIQMTYNTQNLAGAGCWESTDPGLSDYGKRLVALLNEAGILIDLSHVGPQTSKDAAEVSKRPVAYTHVAPAGMKDHPRNKPDDMLKRISGTGGFVGVALYAPFLPKGDDSDLDDCLDTLEYVLNLLGPERVGLGTDFTQGYGADFFEWLRRDKGTGAGVAGPMKGTRPANPKGLDGMSEYPNLIQAMQQRGWDDSLIRNVMGENWLAFLDDAWTPA
jgi:membrane dipeptidase